MLVWQRLARWTVWCQAARRGWSSQAATPSLTTSMRTHTCQSVHQIPVAAAPATPPSGYETRVRLVGWLNHVRRLNAKLIFAGLRDGYGQVEVVASAETQGLELLEELHRESVVSVEGIVRERRRTADVELAEVNEIHASRITVLSHSALLPVPLEEPTTETQQQTLLQHRYLALRLPRLQHNLRTRSRVAHVVRRCLIEQLGFVEVETPTLFRPTAEGAREFLVPTRRKAGLFYALPQSPQQYKQVLMAGGIDRYFQIARCYRDEDHRSDRQPEFTQIDLEMSFIRAHEIRRVIEQLLGQIWQAVGLPPLPAQFPLMRYEDAMERYGVDKPDLRFGMELHHLGAASATLRAALGADARALVAPQLMATASRKDRTAFFESLALPAGVRAHCFAVDEHGAWKWKVFEQLAASEQRHIHELMPARPGDAIVVISQDATPAEPALDLRPLLGALRLKIAQTFPATIPPGAMDRFVPLWIVDFPLFSRGAHPDDPNLPVLESTHHPFTAPIPEDAEAFRQLDARDWDAALRIRGDHYDCVMNGIELGGGSIRIHEAAMQTKVFQEILKIPSAAMWDQFSHLLKALELGTPPHGGIALGFDRLMCILCREPSLREVIAFPKTATGNELMSNAPSAVEPGHLRQYHIRVIE